MAGPKINLPKVGQHSPTEVTNPFACKIRKNPAAGPKDITPFLFSYLPLDRTYSTTWTGDNIFHFSVYKVKLESGKIYQAFDGKRLVFEIGCNTVIYLNINPKSPAHNKFFIESTDQFFSDITTRLTSAIVVQKTRGIETISKYETFFLLGMFSTVSVGMWLMITGSDITFTLAANKAKIDAFRKLASVLMQESDRVKKYAPVLHRKIMELITSQAMVTTAQMAKNLPGHIIKNQNAQAQVAGILYGKYAMSASTFNGWMLLSTLLTQAVVKSVTNTPATYKEVIAARYVSIIRELRNLDWDNPQEVQNVVHKARIVLHDSKVDINEHDIKSIFLEIRAHPKELEASIVNIYNAFLIFFAKK